VAGLREHNCELAVTWTGNTGVGISDYRSCSRDHEVSAPGKSRRLPRSHLASTDSNPHASRVRSEQGCSRQPGGSTRVGGGTRALTPHLELTGERSIGAA